MKDKSAEELRVEAESGRVVAEEGRVVNEFDEEKGRVTAEEARVIAERERAHAESNDGSGRREAEVARVDAETERAVAETSRERAHVAAVAHVEKVQSEFEKELLALRADPGRYMTPGARRYFRRVALGYVILAISTVFGIQAVTDRTDRNIRNDVNAASKEQCLYRIPIIKKFNSLIDIQIESNRGAREIALAEDDHARVRLTTGNIIKLQASRVRVPVPRECDAPVLK